MYISFHFPPHFFITVRHDQISVKDTCPPVITNIPRSPHPAFSFHSATSSKVPKLEK